MAKHHLTANGEPKLCRASSGRCPYERRGEPHFETAEAVRSFFEESMSPPQSRGAELLLEIAAWQKAHPFGYRNNEYYNHIDGLYSELSELEPAVAPAATPLHKETFPLTPLPGELNYGRGHIPDGTPTETLAQLERLSETWVKRLSSSEALAVARYTGSDFDELHEDAGFHQALYSAVVKAPHFQETTVYSGCTTYVKNAVLEALDSGDGASFRMDSFLSTSLNRAVLSRHSYAPEGAKPLSLEIATEQGAVVLLASSSPGELEVLLPPGDYEVTGRRVEKLGHYEEAEILSVRLKAAAVS
jgi:hypothetical protein